MRTHSVTVSFRIPKALADALRVRSEERSVSASEVARQSLSQTLAPYVQTLSTQEVMHHTSLGACAHTAGAGRDQAMCGAKLS